MDTLVDMGNKRYTRMRLPFSFDRVTLVVNQEVLLLPLLPHPRPSPTARVAYRDIWHLERDSPRNGIFLMKLAPFWRKAILADAH